jgi:serine/threonine protein kinase
VSEPLPLPDEREVDAVCLRFEAAWQAGQRPRIEDYLGQTPEPARSALLAELLRLELEYRGRNGEQPTEEEYRTRYPDRELLGRVFAAVPNGVLPHVPGYKVLAEVGRGGMGVVYKARDLGLNRLVALKMIKDDFPDEQDRERFRREARAVARLEHPNIVRVYQFVEPEAGRPYFVMELVEGSDLAKRLDAGPLPPREAARMVERLARAVHHAHQCGIVHRDLKPGNVLLTAAGAPKITDFGLAKHLDLQASLAPSGAVIGTPAYMAPEALGSSRQVGPAADVYGLGAILYECLTGRPPVQAATVLEIFDQVRNQEPEPPSELEPKVPRDLDTVCLKCLKKEPGKRYATAEKLAEDLERYLAGEAIEARPRKLAESVREEIEKRRVVEEPRSWSYLALLSGAVASCTHLAIFCILQAGWPTTLFVPCVAINAVLVFLIGWLCLGRRRQPLTRDEWNVAVVLYATASAAYVLCALAYPFDRESILALYPPLALLIGLYNVVVARLYFGLAYLYGAGYVLLAVVMKWKPEWAPLVFGVAFAADSVSVGLTTRWYRKS